jgi:hypothetical protein
MRRNLFNHMAVGAALLALAACATATPYAPAATPRGYGYSDTQIEANRVRVTFRGNSMTDRETVEASLLLRAAEITLDRGYSYFVVAERDTEARTRVQGFGRSYYPGFYPRWSYFSPRWGWRPWYDPFWDDPVSYRTITQYEASAEITMYRGAKPADNPRAFDASEVRSNLQNRVVRAAPG